MSKSKLVTCLTLLAASFFLAAPFVSYAKASNCHCTKCEKHKHHKKHCKEHCEHSKDKDCMADCEGKS